MEQSHILLKMHVQEKCAWSLNFPDVLHNFDEQGARNRQPSLNPTGTTNRQL